jgi:ribonuclease HI
MSITYLAFCDGGSRGNPGPSACGVVIKKINQKINQDIQEIVCSKGVFLGNDTNNVAEWMGLVTVLELALENRYYPIEIKLDSLLVVSQINDKWKLKAENLKQYYTKSKSLIKQINSNNVKIIHVLREFNKEADLVVNQTLDNI